MASVAHTARNVEITAENLQEELVRLEAQKQALERELAAVVAHLGSVHRTLSALQALVPGTASGVVDAVAVRSPVAPVPVQPRAHEAGDGLFAPVPPDPEPRAQQSRAPEELQQGAPADAHAHRGYGKLTEQIMEYFAEAGDADVRARDVAAALGRDTDSGSINAVRSTLDRLVGTSRIRRAGRGLYHANPF